MRFRIDGKVDETEYSQTAETILDLLHILRSALSVGKDNFEELEYVII